MFFYNVKINLKCMSSVKKHFIKAKLTKRDDQKLISLFSLII